MKISSAEGDSEGLPRLTSNLVSHIVQQFNTEGIHALVKSLEYGDGAADELALLFINALRQYVANESTPSVASEQPPIRAGFKMRIEAKQRLIADLTKKQEQLDINQDGKIDSTDLKKLRQGKKPVKSDLVDPTDDGASFDMLVDGEPEDEQPLVQELTQDDAGVEKAPEQELLVDDLQIM